MKNLISILLFMSCMLCLSHSAMAQTDDDDSRYLKGAVTEEDGKVTFKREFNIPGMSQEQIYNRMLTWLEGNLKENNNDISRIVFTNPEEGVIAGVGEEWLVFKSTALSLDRAMLSYQVNIKCKPEQCIIELGKIRFEYREKEKYTAEELIVDKYALNKAGTKLVSGLAKWRRKTVDFADELFDSAALALSTVKTTAKTETKTTKPAIPNNTPIVIQQTEQVKPAPKENIAPQVETVKPVATNNELKEISPLDVPKDAIKMSEGKLVIVIGSDPFNMVMMTANAGGSIGKVDGKAVVFSILSPDQPYESLDKAENYTVKFFPTNQNEPSLVLDCKSLPSPAMYEGQPRTFVGEITKAWVK